MTTVLIVGAELGDLARLRPALDAAGLQTEPVNGLEAALEVVERAPVDLALVNLARPHLSPGQLRDLMRALADRDGIPSIALLTETQLAKPDFSLGFADFLLCQPVSGAEAVARVHQALWRAGRAQTEESDGVLRCGDLVIDTNRYEVYLGSAPVELTFKEYELLRFFAENQDKVFTREVLLNRVWGYDYFGGARTVDVHIRRLRSKIEDRDHVFIETVRNVGYRFRPGGQE